MPMDLHNVRLRFLAKYENCKEDDIPIVVLIFLEECQNCDWDDIPIMVSDYLRQEVCNYPNVVVNDEMNDDDEEENEVDYYHHKVSQFVLQDSSIIEHEMDENSDFEDDESIEYIDDYSNDYVPRSLEFVIDYSDIEEEEYYQFDNYLQRTTQAVLQESDSFEHEPMEDSTKSGCSNSDFEESMEDVVQESEINLDLEAEKSAVTIFNSEEEEPNVAYEGSNEIAGHDDIIKELQEMLEINDEKLEELVQNGVGDNPILNTEIDRFYQANGEQAKAELFGENDSTNVESKSGLVSNCLPCNYEFLLLIKPKPPYEFLKEFDFSGGMVKSNIGEGQMNELIKLDNFTSLDRTSECVQISYFEEPPDCFSLVKNHSYLRVSLSRILIRSWEEWEVHTLVISFYLRMFCRIVKPKENILQNEYDWKGKGEVMTSTHNETSVWELKPD